MKQIPISVDYQDSDYSLALSKALGLRCKDLIVYDIKEAPPDAFILNESIVALYTPVSQIIAKIMAEHNRQERPAKALRDVTFTAFTSVIGGGGLSSTAYTYARLKSRIYNSKTAFLSFDPKYRKIEFNNDEYGVQSIDDIKSASSFDELVIDIPFGSDNYYDLIDQCDQRIVVMGYLEKRRESNEAFYLDLVKLADSYINPPKTVRLYNSFDPYFDVNDVHGQLGNEIVRLINEK